MALKLRPVVNATPALPIDSMLICWVPNINFLPVAHPLCHLSVKPQPGVIFHNLPTSLTFYSRFRNVKMANKAHWRGCHFWCDARFHSHPFKSSAMSLRANYRHAEIYSWKSHLRFYSYWKRRMNGFGLSASKKRGLTLLVMWES